MPKQNRTIVGKFIHYMRRGRRVPDLPRHFVTTYDVDELDADTRMVMMAARSRDPRRVRYLEKLYGARGVDLLDLLPPPRRMTIWERLAAFGRRIEGTYPYRVSGYRHTRQPSTRSRFYIPLKVKMGERK